MTDDRWESLVEGVLDDFTADAALRQDVWRTLRKRRDYYYEYSFFRAGDGQRARRKIAEMIRGILNRKEPGDGEHNG